MNTNELAFAFCCKLEYGCKIIVKCRSFLVDGLCCLPSFLINKNFDVKFSLLMISSIVFLFLSHKGKYTLQILLVELH